MTAVTFLQPARLTIGSGCFSECRDYLAALPGARIHVVTSPSFAARAEVLAADLRSCGLSASVDATTGAEPTLSHFAATLQRAREAEPTCIVGLGGGSALDLAKLLAAFVRSMQPVEETFGIGLLAGRACHLVCVPTTSGTGSEVSPNAILLDEASRLKKGVISPFLVPDATFIDPELTLSLPPAITAFTGVDALTHCVEAFTNIHAHPVVDVYALRGMHLCSQHLVRAVRQGDDLEAREGMALASFYGGLCLGPVNTAAVHALAYPLGGEFHVPHGLSNAVLLPAVFRFNAEATPERHAEAAVALGAERGGDALQTALRGADKLRELVADCGISADLSRFGVTRAAVPSMASAALTVTRLLRNNPRPLTQADAEAIYTAALF